MVVIK